MNSITDWILIKIFMRMRPSKWPKLINIGFGGIFDDYFFKKYFRIYGIPKTHQPDLPQLIGWDLRQEQDIDISKTPWANYTTQNIQWITGDDNNGYTIYYDSEYAVFEYIDNEIKDLVRSSMRSGHNYYRANMYGYFATYVVKYPKTGDIGIITFISYNPYDIITVGYYLPSFDLWEYNSTTYYYGQSIDGLRWGKGVVKFDNDFELYMDGWPDLNLLKNAKGANIPPTPIDFPNLLSKIMEKYLDWGEKINYFFEDLEDY